MSVMSHLGYHPELLAHVTVFVDTGKMGFVMQDIDGMKTKAIVTLPYGADASLDNLSLSNSS